MGRDRAAAQVIALYGSPISRNAASVTIFKIISPRRLVKRGPDDPGIRNFCVADNARLVEIFCV
jgi:hypothetical protein